jgi:chaperonin cofactor prefoldin
MAYNLDDIYNKIDELENKINSLSKFDYEAKNIKNVGNVVVDNQGNPLKVNYAKNTSTIEGKTYDEFLKEMQDFIKPLIEDIKTNLKKQNDEKPLGASYIKDWSELKIDKTKDLQTLALDTLDFTPSFLEILVKVDMCTEKNGGSNKTITQIPPIGISIDGMPFSEDGKNLKNYSAWWVEDNQIKAYFKKADFPQWIGGCSKILYKILAWR